MIRALTLLIAFWLGLATTASAVVPTAAVNDANYTIDINTTNVILQSAFTAPRTITLPYAAGTQIGQGGASIMYQTTLNIFDTVCTLGAVNTLTIAPQPNNTINGSASPLVISTPCARVTLWPLSGSNWYAFSAPLNGISGVAAGSPGQVQYNAAGAFGGISGATSNGTTLTLVAPILGTPASMVATNVTGTAAGLTAGNVTTNANLTGAVTSVGNAASLGAFSSANLRGALSDESGTGLAYFQGGDIGTPSVGVATNLSGTAASLTAGNATKLTTPRAIGIAGSTGLTATGVNFDGSAAINPALTGILAVANGGVPQSAWTALTPGTLCAAGSPTFTSTGRWQQIAPKTTLVEYDITVTAISTCDSSINTVSMTLPNTSQSGAGGSAYDFVGAASMFCWIPSSSTQISCRSVTATGANKLVTNSHFVLSTVYENQ